MAIAVIGSSEMIIFAVVFGSKYKISFVPITEPVMENARPQRAIFQMTFLLFTKLSKAAAVPKREANLFVPNADCGGIPAISNDGIRISPPPPAMLSRNPAKNDIKQSIKIVDSSINLYFILMHRFRAFFILMKSYDVYNVNTLFRSTAICV